MADKKAFEIRDGKTIITYDGSLRIQKGNRVGAFSMRKLMKILEPHMVTYSDKIEPPKVELKYEVDAPLRRGKSRSGPQFVSVKRQIEVDYGFTPKDIERRYYEMNRKKVLEKKWRTDGEFDYILFLGYASEHEINSILNWEGKNN